MWDYSDEFTSKLFHVKRPYIISEKIDVSIYYISIL